MNNTMDGEVALLGDHSEQASHVDSDVENDLVIADPAPPSVCAPSMCVKPTWGLWMRYSAALEKRPLLVKSITACIILGLGDLAGQSVESWRGAHGVTTHVDIARVVRFAIFGLILQAPWNHFYYLILDGALPPTPHPWTKRTFLKVFIDQFVQAPVFTILIFVFLGSLQGKSLSDIKDQIDDEYIRTMLANWKLWVPTTVVNIAFVPPIFRVLYLNVVFFFWSIILSLILNSR